ncbi:hypothetical protein KR093_010575, partial [Drosophila rubida]
MSNPSMPPRRLAPGAATPVVARSVPVATAAQPAAPAATAVLAARLSDSNTVTSSALTLEQAAAPLLQPTAATSCPDSPIRRVSSSLKNSALDFASRFFNKCKAATFTVDGATYTIGEYTRRSTKKSAKRECV